MMRNKSCSPGGISMELHKYIPLMVVKIQSCAWITLVTPVIELIDT